jgi:hypothetical protein
VTELIAWLKANPGAEHISGVHIVEALPTGSLAIKDRLRPG